MGDEIRFGIRVATVVEFGRCCEGVGSGQDRMKDYTGEFHDVAVVLLPQLSDNYFFVVIAVMSFISRRRFSKKNEASMSVIKLCKRGNRAKINVT